MEWYIKCFKHYADFSGRARRKEYWYFVLFNFLFSFVLGCIDIAIIYATETETPVTILSWLYSLVVFIPGLAVIVRRLHDVGKSGWYYFIGLIPIVGAIILLVWSLTEGQRFENQWGPDPKAVQAPTSGFRTNYRM